LDDRTSQLLAIAFNRLPPPERLVALVEHLDNFPEALPPEAVLALHAATTEQREPIEQLRQLNIPQAGIAQLDAPERYLWVLACVPGCAAKLACGALIVGPARDLRDLRLAFQKVGACCQALRASELVRKCISTSLAVGNFMNRGTARCGARAVLLPDSLLKLDELRGVVEVPLDPGTECSRGEGLRAPSLLDFVAQALIDEASNSRPRDFRAEAEELRAKARAAQTVCLEEAEASCKQVCLAAARARSSLGELAMTPDVSRLAERVRLVCDEADVAAKLVRAAKEELAITQQWSCAKGKVKGDEWFAGWAQFLDQLASALGRTKPPAQRASAPSSTGSVLKEINVLHDSNIAALVGKACDGATHGVMRPSRGPATGGSTCGPEATAALASPTLAALPLQRKDAACDDDARAESFDIGALLLKSGLQGHAVKQSQVGPSSDATVEQIRTSLMLRADVQYPYIQIADLRTECATLQTQSMMWTQFQVDGINGLYRGEVAEVERLNQQLLR